MYRQVRPAPADVVTDTQVLHRSRSRYVKRYGQATSSKASTLQTAALSTIRDGPFTTLHSDASGRITQGASYALALANTILSSGRNWFFGKWANARHSADDGLSFRRFKRLPLDSNEVTSKAHLTNTLPVAYLKALPGDQFRWTDDPLAHLGQHNHELVTAFVADIIEGMRTDQFVQFRDIPHPIDPNRLPPSVVAALRTTGKPEKLSIFLHNYMMHVADQNDDKCFYESGIQLLQNLNNFSIAHKHTYYGGGRITTYKMLGLKPYGPLKFPYKQFGADPLLERERLLSTIRCLQFLLSQRHLYNQYFPVQTLAGIVADLDAMRRDQPPPSYVDWPSKNQTMPGSYPEDHMDGLLFDTIAMRDFEPARLWDEWHPSPAKGVTVDDYNTPYRKAMKKNTLVYDTLGRAQAQKPALRKEGGAEVRKKTATFVTGPVAFYAPSANKPVENIDPTSNPNRPRSDFATAIEEASDLQAQPIPAKEPSFRAHIENQQAEFTSLKTHQPTRLEHAVAESSTQHLNQKPKAITAWALERASWKTPKPLPKVKYRSIDDFFGGDNSKSIWGSPASLTISQEKKDEFELRVQLMGEAGYQSQREKEAERKRREEEELRRAEERRRIAEEKHRKAEEERRRAEEERIRKEDEYLAATGELRRPRTALIPDLSMEWIERVDRTLSARANVDLATTPEGIGLRRKDFETVIPQNQWLNDEIVNGTLLHLGTYVNQKVGIKNTRLETPKLQVFNSFIGTNLVEGKPITERMMRRAGIRKDNFLDIETVLVPICRGKHWTLVVVRPKHREIFHLDSMSRNGDMGLKRKAHDWIRGILGDAFVDSDWTFRPISSPLQCNSDDCGMHVITNGICIGLGIDPSAYTSADIPLQRLRVAAVLLNGGFKEDLSLDGV